MFSTTYVVVYSEMSMAVESTRGIAVRVELFLIPDGHRVLIV